MDDHKPNIRDKDFAARLIMSIFHWVQRKMPTRAAMERSKYLKPIAHRILVSELWRFTRRSVPRGVALGMLAAFLVPVGQIFAAVFLALPVRANVLGRSSEPYRKIHIADGCDDRRPADQHANAKRIWSMADLAGARGGGDRLRFFRVRNIFAAIGYLISSWGWRWWIGRKRRDRLNKILGERSGDGQ